ncbi:RHS repeat domain-containing protein [Orenia metallireducens]|nr:RHS repeat-associated core domain-containing protein [Orenia metallireducens]
MRVSTEITYFHHDNLGSTRLMTDSSGKVVIDQDYLPFGGDLARSNQIEIQNDSGENYKYTGQKQVVSIGLYYYGARYYDPEIGRFVTEDSYRGELDKPQTQHLYIYVTNNPLRYTDPSGNSRRDPFHEFMTNVLWNGIQEIKSFNNPRTRAYFKGVGDSWVDTGKGVVDFARDPINNSINAAKSAYNTGKQAYGYVTSNSLGQIYQDGVNLAKSNYNAFQQLSPEEKAYALGRGANNIGMDVLAGGAGAEALDKVADAAKNSGLVNKFNNLDVEGANQFELYRRTKNTGEFSGLSEPMQLRHVKKTAKKAGIGLKGVKVKIVRDPDLMGRDLYGYAGGNRIQLYPDAFSSRENLVKTLGHERMHIYQESIFGKPKDTTTLNKFEKAAYGSEEMWWDHYLNNKGK